LFIDFHVFGAKKQENLISGSTRPFSVSSEKKMCTQTSKLRYSGFGAFGAFGASQILKLNLWLYL